MSISTDTIHIELRREDGCCISEGRLSVVFLDRVKRRSRAGALAEEPRDRLIVAGTVVVLGNWDGLGSPMLLGVEGSWSYLYIRQQKKKYITHLNQGWAWFPRATD